MMKLTAHSKSYIDFPMKMVGLGLMTFALSAATGNLATGEFVLTAGFAVSLVLGGIGYGVTKQKSDAAHKRLDDLHNVVEASLVDAASHRTRIEHDIVEIRIAMATLAAGEKRRERERTED
jgi:hypothetical protein